jgi:hypothetical protein
LNAGADLPPRGFEVKTADDGSPVILYRTRGMGCSAAFFAGWLTIWGLVCVGGAYEALVAPAGMNLLLALFILPFWVIGFLVAGYVAWYFFSATRFTFGPDLLVVERSLWRFRRKRQFGRAEVTVVRQVKDGGEGEDSFPSWALAVVGRKEIRVLSKQPLDKSAWLGPIIARWAGVPFEPWKADPEPKYEVL